VRGKCHNDRSRAAIQVIASCRLGRWRATRCEGKRKWDRWDSNPEPKDYETGVGKLEPCDAVGSSGDQGVVVAPMVALAAGDLGCKVVSLGDDESRTEVVVPPELVVLVERWPMLSELVRRVVLALMGGSLPKPIEAALLALLESVR